MEGQHSQQPQAARTKWAAVALSTARMLKTAAASHLEKRGAGGLVCIEAVFVASASEQVVQDLHLLLERPVKKKEKFSARLHFQRHLIAL